MNQPLDQPIIIDHAELILRNPIIHLADNIV
jgi:hypothetical protein